MMVYCGREGGNCPCTTTGECIHSARGLAADRPRSAASWKAFGLACCATSAAGMVTLAIWVLS